MHLNALFCLSLESRRLKSFAQSLSLNNLPSPLCMDVKNELAFESKFYSRKKIIIK